MLPPSDRLKQLGFMPSVTVDPNRKVNMYFKSGSNMFRSAEMHLDNGHLEDAYKLFLKFSTLFITDIRTHPKFNEVSPKEKDQNTAFVKKALCKAEEIKKTLSERYTRDYESYLEEQRKEKQRQQQDSERSELIQERQHQELIENKEQQHREQTAFPPEGPSWEHNIHADTSLLGVHYPNVDIHPRTPHSAKTNEPTPTDNLDYKRRTPLVDRSTKPVSLINSTAQSSQRLKTVVIPSQLFGRFRSLAHTATLNNVETCGILAGRLESSSVLITHLLVPKQHGTSNSCTAENEEEVFDYQDNNNLITLGWIHTHPSQTAFLSSVDLHTHCPYQLMMPEAIAIVCAPKYKEDGIFCLTPDYGLEFIAKCRQTGFHPHPSDPPLYMEADHIRMDSTQEILVVDLRR